VTITELQSQRRWLLWRLEPRKGAKPDEKPTKVPYQPDGRRARANDPVTWSTYAECLAVVSQFSGIGVALGDGVWGVDIDVCCDAATGKFTPESREIVIGLDSYSEFSPSGTGCHVLGVGELPGDGKQIVKQIPGCKQIEIKGSGCYLTFTGRHLSKTPHDLLDRQPQLDSLCEHVRQSANSGTLRVIVPADEETKFRKLWAGDMSDYGDNHSSADLALCIILARRTNCNAFLIDEQFRKSALYRDKWERVDYKWSTIWKAIQAAKGAPVPADDADAVEEDGETEYVVDALPDFPAHAGWFPKGEISLIGGSSGVGKTSWAMPLLESIRQGQSVLGHPVKSREYRALLHDRSKKAMRRTMESLGLKSESVERIIRLSPAQQACPPSDVLEASIVENPGVEVWLIEGLDLWISDMNKSSVVQAVLGGLQDVAMRHDVCVLATVGMPKQKGKDRYYGRDSLFGSAALARKAETIVLLNMYDETDNSSVRQCDVLPRYSAAERFHFTWRNGHFCLTDAPESQPENTALYRMERNVFAKYKPGELVIYSAELGPEGTFYRWRKQAAKDGKLVYAGGRYLVPPAREEKVN